jgi:threonyl-tRNA synthetase
MPQVQLPDGSVKDFASGITPLEIAEGIGARLAKACIAAMVDGAIVDLRRPLPDSATPLAFRLLTEKDAESLGVLRHSCAHVMARAVMRVFPNVGLAFGPTTGSGFYYDFDMPDRIREEDFPRIEAEMQKIVADAETFDRFELPRDEAAKFVGDLHQELKSNHIATGLAEHATLSFYRQGEFVDLCRGPHIPDAGRIKAFKLLSVAGAHWKGDTSAKPLQRLYGTAFFSEKDLDAYLTQIDEAKRRDHRVLGKLHNLFHISPEVGQGLCLWLPKGATVRTLLEDWIKTELLKRGYQPVYTPHIGRVELYETSGHFPYYRDSQFAPLFGHPAGAFIDRWITLLTAGELTPDKEAKFVEFVGLLDCDLSAYKPAAPHSEKLQVLRDWQAKQERYLLKPMNCPHHVQVYKSQPRSYRDLPVRLAEFGTVYRHEQSGELNGLLRVRGLTQDDAHLFCTTEQVEDEFRATIQLVRYHLETLGLNDYRVQLSLRDPKSDKYVGTEENWQRAEAALRRVLTELGLPFTACEGEAAFYGPKADFMVRDVIGREWQLGTVQLDYNLPERFELEYIGTDNKPHRPVMIHRAPLGSMERFTGVLIEHFAAAFPLWLAPEQVRILPISSDKFGDYAMEVERALSAEGFRVTTDLRPEKIGHKIRDAQVSLVPYMFVVGAKEVEDRAVAVRDRIDGDVGAMPLAAAIARLRDEVDTKKIRQTSQLASAPAVAQPAGEEQNEY